MSPTAQLASGVVVVLAGCAQAGAPFAGFEDLARSGGMRDAGSRDLARLADQAEPSDSAVERDASAVADFANPAADLSRSVTGDLSAPVVDLTVLAAADLATPSDLAAPSPDLGGVDLAGGCVPVHQPCDEVCQNCAAGLRCTLANTGMATVCVAAGTVMSGQPCGNGAGACIVGDVCLFESSRIPLNVCMPFCRVDADCTNGGRCVGDLGNGFRVCSEPITNCDPVTLAGCASGGCYMVTPDGATGCHQVGQGGQGAACDTDYDCSAGYICLSVNMGAQACYRLCNTTADCPNGKSCNGGITGTTRSFCF
jgi:hypothetical protein